MNFEMLAPYYETASSVGLVVGGVVIGHVLPPLLARVRAAGAAFVARVKAAAKKDVAVVEADWHADVAAVEARVTSLESDVLHLFQTSTPPALAEVINPAVPAAVVVPVTA